MPYDNRKLLLLATLITIGLSFVPYSEYLLYPLRIFVTFIHESGHAIAALLTGGSVDSMHISPNGSGVTFTRESPLWAWVVLSGGYVGSALFGALLLQTGRLTRWANAGRTTLYAAAVYIAAITLLWGCHPFSNPSNSITGGGAPDFFTMLAGICLFVLLFAAGKLSSPRVAGFLSAFLAVQCSLNALVDLRNLLFITSNNLGDNDAKFMADQYHLLPATFWALLWAGISGTIILLSLWSYNRSIAAQMRAAGSYDALPPE